MPGDSNKDIEYLLDKWERLSTIQRYLLLFRAYWIKNRTKHVYVWALFLILFGRYLRGNNVLVGHHNNMLTGLLRILLGLLIFVLLIRIWRLTGLHNKLGDWPNLFILIIGRWLVLHYELGVIRLIIIPPIILLVWIYTYILYHVLVGKNSQSV